MTPLYEELDELEEGPSDRCDIDPIAALREQDDYDREFAREALFGKVKHRRLKIHQANYSTVWSKKPDWMKDPSKLPKKPPTK